MDPNSSKALISTMSKKWKLEQIPTKKLELENKLMEERLNQLKNELLNDKQKRSAQGGFWSKGQAGPIANYGKQTKENGNESVLTKLTNRQMKLKVLVDEALVTKSEAKATGTTKDKRAKCGQCEKKIAFTRCLECCEDYCANCFTDFHMKGALQKHRALPINTNFNSETTSSQKFTESQNEFQNEVYKQQQIQQTYESENSYSNIYEYKPEPQRMMSAETRKIKTLIEPLEPDEASNSLLNGTYDEREAQESFKKAVMEWRNSKPVATGVVTAPTPTNILNKENMEIKTSRNASIGTESSGLNTDRSVNQKIKILENQINSTHSLTYAERCLVHKYRRNDLKFPTVDDDKNMISDDSNEKLILSKSLDTHSLKRDTSARSIKSPNMSRSINSAIKLDKSNETFTRVSINPTPVLIEEIPQSLNLNSGLTTSELKNLEPEIIETKPESIKIPTLIESYTRPDSVSSKRPKTPSSRPQSSRPNSSLRKSVQMESNLCRNTSDELKKVTQRNVSLDEKIQNDLGAFLMLEVDKDNSLDVLTSRETKTKNEPIKVSHMLYEMSARSWKPSLSLVPNLKENEEVKLPERSEGINIEENSNKVNNLAINTQLPQMPNQNVNMIKSKKSSINTNSDRSNSSIGFKHKSLDFKDKKDFDRNKSFVASEKSNLIKTAQKRAISVAGNYALSNIANIELGKEFTEYDVDDGRSSRVCQNEEDETYFGLLEKEFKAKTPRKTDFSSKKSTDYDNINLNELNAKIIKNLSTGLDFSLRNEELSDSEMENLTLEELKSLQ